MSSIALVAVGGAIGTGAREVLSLAIPPLGGVPVAIFGINVAGAFVLGLLLEALLLRGPDAGFRRALRLFVGTGVLGGFTTYSALATDTELLIRDGRFWIGAGYAVATVVIGGFASLAGIAISARLGRRAGAHGAGSGAAPGGGTGGLGGGRGEPGGRRGEPDGARGEPGGGPDAGSAEGVGG